MRVDVLTIFPEMFDGPMSASILGIAREKGALELFVHDLRDWTTDNHRTVDDAPYGGGQGMVMMPGPLFSALRDIIVLDQRKPRCLFMTPAGTPFAQRDAVRFSEEERLLFVCGRYEGIDERVIEEFADEEISIGDYVLTGGELPAMVIIDSVTRLLEDVLGNEMSAVEESFSEGLLEHPQYTRPAEFEGRAVPDVLISGNHQKIAQWRAEQSYNRTIERRPDLLKDTHELN